MLDPQREERLEELFGEALELPPEDREAFVAERCAGDEELAARLTQLLEEDTRGTEGFLAGGALVTPRKPEERIGPYRLMSLLGEGGMGSVHLAAQLEPVRRMVALKTIRLGGGEQVLARFDSERQALARLGHPNVAEIYDSGTTESGLPWFAMEYCPGRPFDQHCDRERLSVEDRLRLLLEVCDAVQHAHLRGVLHLDLKPANVLVTQRDGRPAPKVIDFGLARAVAGTLTADPDERREDGPVGTWLYMSPEQADPRGDVDARADVWALGALLYETLCGEPPYAEESTAGIAARLAVEDPLAPSLRLAALPGERARAVASARRSTPAALAKRLRDDLDAIALRALERDRARRYRTPSELATDLQRNLDHEPVEAVPARAFYLLRKLVRRHRLAFALGAVSSAAVLGGLGFGWTNAARARDAEAARREHLQRTLSAASARGELLQLALLEDPDLPLRELLARAEPAIAGLHVGDPVGEAALRRSLGGTWLNLGEPTRARLQLERAWLLVSDGADVDELERYQTLDALLRSTRADGQPVDEELSLRCARMALALLGEELPRLGSALEELFEAARTPDSSEAQLRERLDAAARELPERIMSLERAQLVARVLAEASVALSRAGRAEESGRLSRALEALARDTLDPNGSAWPYFLWRAAAKHLHGDPVLPERAAELAAELEAAAARRNLGEDHWMVREARRIQAEAENAAAADRR